MTTYKNITLEEADVMWQLGVPIWLRRVTGDTFGWIGYLNINDIPSEDYRRALEKEVAKETDVFEYRVEVE